MLTALDKLWKYNLDGGAASGMHVDATYKTSRTAMAGLLLAALLFGMGLAVAFSRALLRRLGGEPARAAQVAQAVAAGDLTSAITLRAGDTTSLKAQLGAMQASLARAVSAVRTGSEQVATASAQIAQGNQDLSQRTEQQASALQQTAATMDELGTTVRTNSDNAQQANELALGAAQVATQGGEVVGQVVQTMKGIQDASRKIGEIISVIDGIAFQTNILALNAAVEAARAANRAAASRSLPARCARSHSAAPPPPRRSRPDHDERRPRRTRHRLVDRAGVTMGEIVKSIQRVTAIVGEISSASSEQSTGVGQVGQAITQMDQTTQQNAALVEESAAAAESLHQQAGQLLESVAVFRLAGDASRAGATVH